MIEKSTNRDGVEGSERQQHDPAGLGEENGPADKYGPNGGTNTNLGGDFNIINLSHGIGNGMDYNHMMHIMPGNMGSSMANYTPMMGKSNRKECKLYIKFNR
jgi:hypothetical protein